MTNRIETDKDGNTRTYDANGNCIHQKNTLGLEHWFEYDYQSNGKMIHYKNSYGFEEWFEYDTNGNCIHYKNSDGSEIWYDSNGREIIKPE